MQLRFVCGLAAMLATPLFGQIMTGNVSTQGKTVTGSMRFQPRAFWPVVTGVPYSAERVIEQVQVGSDGTRFTQTHELQTICRDSEGRTRTERSMGPLGDNAPKIVEIFDPVANVTYTFVLGTEQKIAHRTAVPERPAVRTLPHAATASSGGEGGAVLFSVSGSVGAPVASAIAPAPPNAQTRPEMKREDLGTQMIEGVMANGTRMVQTFPTGSQGNDRPFQVTMENWVSSELKEAILTKNVDPRRGESTTKLTNISRDNPPADRFLPPADYSVTDETGPFEIEWTATRK